MILDSGLLFGATLCIILNFNYAESISELLVSVLWDIMNNCTDWQWLLIYAKLVWWFVFVIVRYNTCKK